MISYFYALFVYLFINTLITLFIAGKKIKFRWRKLILLLLISPIGGVLWFDFFMALGEERKKNTLLRHKIMRLEKNQKTI